MKTQTIKLRPSLGRINVSSTRAFMSGRMERN